MSYQKADQSFIDYQDAGFGIEAQTFRHPPLGELSGYVSVIGAAQTYGRYVETPFPELLSNELGVPVVNFGTGGAGPAQFFCDTEVLRAINASDVCVIQVMSARSVSNRYFTVRPLRNAELKSISDELLEACPALRERNVQFTHDLLHIVSKSNPEFFAKLQNNSRFWWQKTYETLLYSIKTKKVLFWFSEREPAAVKENYDNGRKLSKFPHLVNQKMIDAVAPLADAFVSCVSSSGLPQDLTVNGEPVLIDNSGNTRTKNAYYPSPEMHRLASEALAGPIKTLLDAPRPGAAPAVRRFVPRKPRTLVHSHIPKTAGNSLNRRLFLPNFAKMDVFLADKAGTTAPAKALNEFVAKKPKGALVVGHVPYGCVAEADPDAVYFSVLREPSSRFISFLNYALSLKSHGLWKRFGEGAHEAALADPNILVKQVVDHPDLAQFQSNVMTRMCAGLRRRAKEPITEEMLQQALTNLDKPNFVVGLNTDLEEFIKEISEAYSLTYFDDAYLEACANDDSRYIYRPAYEKQRPNRVSAETLSAESRASIDAMNDIDRKLYDRLAARLGKLAEA